MDVKKLLEKFSLDDTPCGLGGCKNDGTSYECCEYDITLFDNKSEDTLVAEFENEFIKIHHGSLNESNSNILVQYDNLKIITDEQWELRMLLSRINEKKQQIFKDFTKSCLLDALFCISKTKDGLKNSDPFAASWLKCSACFIADAICGFNLKRPSPTHMLDKMREFEKNRVNKNFSIVNECIGIERATSSLLSRMCKSTMGFSDMVESNGHSKIIQQKHDYLIHNSLLADCYFYLAYINRNNLIKVKNVLHQKAELIHILKVGFDVENDTLKIEQQADLLQKTTNELLALQSSS